jgi:hypothetical protein
MTAKQKDIIRKLLDGYTIVGNSAYGFRLRDQKKNVAIKFSYKTFFRIKHPLRKHKDCFLVDKNKMRQMHGSSFAKQLYKKQSKKSAACAPCSFQLPSRTIVTKFSKRKSVQLSDETKSQLQIF